MEAFGCNPSAKLVINLIQSGGSVEDVDFWTGQEVGYSSYFASNYSMNIIE